ncbi:MAG: twin-arginine translocation signal domain-containing protein [Lacunisphaera sp.]
MPAHPIPTRSLDRRDFLKLTAAATTATMLAPWLRADQPARPPRPFEIAAPLYAWDLHDEGVIRILDDLQEMCAVNSVYLVGVMHPERRPFPDPNGTYPHNPKRQSYQVEDGRSYWLPDASLYGRVKPRLSDHDWLNRTDWLHELVTEARKRGLKTGVEFSHTLIDAERMQGEFADLAQRNVHGEVTAEGRIKWLRPPCPNHPATSDYFLAMGLDAVVNHDVDLVQSCIMSFDPGKPEQGGGCFCGHCKRTAKALGMDLDRIQAALLADIHDSGAIAEWTLFRNRSNVLFYKKLSDGIHAKKPTVDLRYNAPSPSYLYYGVDLALMRPVLNSVRLTDYAEQEAKPERMAAKRQWLAERRQEVGPDFPLIAALGVRLHATEGIGPRGHPHRPGNRDERRHVGPLRLRHLRPAPHGPLRPGRRRRPGRVLQGRARSKRLVAAGFIL